MSSLAQKCRPKHQVLVLKCYPRTTKGAVDVKPNSSELSYLLFYASTRRSKVQKVGAFLEKKTASDVWHARIGNVQITLQILTALIENSPRDLPLYAPYVLKILDLILKSRDIDMVEASLPLFDAFCHNHDSAAISAEQEFISEYEDAIEGYAAFATTHPPPSKTPISPPVALRWRSAGLQAIRSVVSAEALAGLLWRQLGVIVPVLLENIWSPDETNLSILLKKANLTEKSDIEKSMRRRGSVATARTTTDDSETNPAVLTESAADADKLAQEDIGVLALHCLRQLSMANNRPQLRGTTSALIKFLASHIAHGESLTKINKTTNEDKGWASSVYLLICRWAPVQDRYVILGTSMENLMNSPAVEEDLPNQIVLATIIDSLLRSDINLIGLSVMDIQLGFIRHLLRVLHLEPSKDDNGKSLKWENDGDGAFSPPSAARVMLISRLQQCIRDLATHTYYADQISDMVSAILHRLRPAVVIPGVSEKVESAGDSAPTIPSVSDDSSPESFFSHATAKVEALKAIKQILLVANSKSRVSGSSSVARNRVGIHVWEGTQWLLRDGDGIVRQAYIDSLLTWLDLEVVRADLQLFDDKVSIKKGAQGDLSRRAVSNASHKDKLSKAPKTKFIQFLTVAIYETALQYVDCEADLAILHLLLSRMNEKLGVNAVRNTLPMVVRLQEEIQALEKPISKVRLGSLCHGYFWSLGKTFGFENSELGAEVTGEVSRRRSKDLWVSAISVPPRGVQQIGLLGEVTNREIPMSQAESESLKAFDGVEHVVEAIAVSYETSMSSPPTSPSTSPGRGFILPVDASSAAPSFPRAKIPDNVKEEMLAEWSPETVLAIAQETSKSGSFTGSRNGTQATGHRNFLAVTASNGGHSGAATPPHHSRPPSQAYGLVGSLTAQKLRKLGGTEFPPSQGSESSRHSVTRVDQLKRVLSGQAPPTRGVGTAHSDASSESLVSYDFTVSDASIINQPIGNGEGSARASIDRSGQKENEAEIPPVPRIPISLSMTPNLSPSENAGTAAKAGTLDSIGEFAQRTPSMKRRPKTRSGNDSHANSWAIEGAGMPDLESLLKGISTSDEGKSLGFIAQPPY